MVLNIMCSSTKLSRIKNTHRPNADAQNRHSNNNQEEVEEPVDDSFKSIINLC